MKAGELRQRILIQSRGNTADALGQPVPTWPTFATIWARAVPLEGRDAFAARQIFPDADTRFEFRYLEGIDTTMRIVWQGRAYQILGLPADVEGRGREIHVLTKWISPGQAA